MLYATQDDGVSLEDVGALIDSFPGQPLDFFGALRAATYDNQIRQWIREDVVKADLTDDDANMRELSKRLINKCVLVWPWVLLCKLPLKGLPETLLSTVVFSTLTHLSFLCCVLGHVDQCHHRFGKMVREGLLQDMVLAAASKSSCAEPTSLVHCRENLPTFEPVQLALEDLLKEGNRLAEEQEMVNKMKLSEEYMKNSGDTSGVSLVGLQG